MFEKYKISWSIFYLGESVQKPVATLLFKIKSLTALLTTGGYLYGNTDACVAVALIGFTVDIIVSCIQLEEIKS